MHVDDRGMAERADMFWNRSKDNAFFRKLAPILIGFGKADRFTPDLLIEDEYDLSGFGFQAIIISIAGHSKGSIGILTASGDLFCGDLLENTEKPALNAIMDNPLEANVSVEKLRNLAINTVYPGHGKPFPMEQIIIRSYRL